MKSKTICLLLILLLCLFAAGCSNNKNSLGSKTSSDKTSDSSISENLPTDTNTDTNTDSNSGTAQAVPQSQSNSKSNSQSSKTKNPSVNTNKSSISDSFKAVLQNKAQFFSTDDKKEMYLNDLLNNKFPGTILKATHFAVLNMDEDKTPEVVIELSTGGYPNCFEILHYLDGKVYGYNIVYRGLENLKEDGTFIASSGWADNEYGKLTFKKDSCEMDRLAYTESNQGSSGTTISYFINNKPVKKESFDSFANKQNAKKDAILYEFTPKNIETELSKSLQ